MFEPDTRSIEHKHILSAQHRLITDAQHFVMVLGMGPQDFRNFLIHSCSLTHNIWYNIHLK